MGEGKEKHAGKALLEERKDFVKSAKQMCKLLEENENPIYPLVILKRLWADGAGGIQKAAVEKVFSEERMHVEFFSAEEFRVVRA